MFSYFSCRTGAYEVVCHCTLARFQPDSSVICQDLKNQQPFSILVMPPVLQIVFFLVFSFRSKKTTMETGRSRPLLQVNGSGLWVQCGSNEETVGGAFFVPLGPGDVAVHGWDVVHGVHLKELRKVGKNGDF